MSVYISNEAVYESIDKTYEDVLSMLQELYKIKTNEPNEDWKARMMDTCFVMDTLEDLLELRLDGRTEYYLGEEHKQRLRELFDKINGEPTVMTEFHLKEICELFGCSIRHPEQEVLPMMVALPSEDEREMRRDAEAMRKLKQWITDTKDDEDSDIWEFMGDELGISASGDHCCGSSYLEKELEQDKGLLLDEIAELKDELEKEKEQNAKLMFMAFTASELVDKLKEEKKQEEQKVNNLMKYVVPGVVDSLKADIAKLKEENAKLQEKYDHEYKYRELEHHNLTFIHNKLDEENDELRAENAKLKNANEKRLDGFNAHFSREELPKDDEVSDYVWEDFKDTFHLNAGVEHRECLEEMWENYKQECREGEHCCAAMCDSCGKYACLEEDTTPSRQQVCGDCYTKIEDITKDAIEGECEDCGCEDGRKEGMLDSWLYKHEEGLYCDGCKEAPELGKKLEELQKMYGKLTYNPETNDWTDADGMVRILMSEMLDPERNASDMMLSDA